MLNHETHEKDLNRMESGIVRGALELKGVVGSCSLS